MNLFSKKSALLAVICVVAVLSVFFVLGCDGETELDPDEAENGEVDEAVDEQLSFVCHDPGTPFYSNAVAFSSAVEQNSDLMITPQPVTSTLAFPEHIKDGSAQLAISTSTDLYSIWEGTGSFKGEDHSHARAVLMGGELKNGFFSCKTSGILELDDIPGSDFTIHLAAAQTGQNLEDALLEITGWEPDEDFNRLEAEHIFPAWNDLAEGRTEVINSTISAADIEEAAVRIEPWLIEMDQEFMEQVVELYPEFHITETRRDYATIPEGTPALAVGEWFYSSEEVSNEIIYEFLETAYENFDAAYEASPEHMEGWEPEGWASEETPLPYHEGAVEFFEDQGMWTDEMEEIQQELLEEAQ